MLLHTVITILSIICLILVNHKLGPAHDDKKSGDYKTDAVHQALETAAGLSCRPVST